VSYHLQPLDADETANYVNHRLRRAAAGPPVVFPRTVTELIHARSRGVPRIINVISDATLLFAYGVDRRDVDASIVQEALDELDATGVLASYHAEGGHPEAAIPLAAVAPAAAAAAPAAPDPRVLEEARRRDLELKQREQQVTAREQALAAQKKVMEEEARLLAAARTHAPAAAVTQPAAAAAPAPVQPAPAPMQAAPAAMHGAPTMTQGAPTMIQGAPTANHAASAVKPVAPRVMAPAVITPSGVRVQRYQPAAYPRPVTRYGMWERLRRVLFGVTEPHTH
jgi:general secretion pathway protein A